MTTQFRLPVALTAGCVLAGLLQAPGLARQGPPPGGPGFGMQSEVKLVKQFDKDGDKVLNTAERKAALAFLEHQGVGGGGGRGGFRGRGGAPAGVVEKGRTLTPKDVTLFPNAPLFDPATYRTFFLTFADADWESEMTAFKNTDVDVPATLVVDGKTYRDVGAHFHGSSSFMMVPTGQKHSLNLKLDLVHAEQEIGGQHTLILLNSAEDATFVRSVLYLAAAREYLPASKANHARVVIDNESWGAYVNVQHYSKEFIGDWFKTTDGARWKVPGNPGARGGLEYLGTDAAPYKSHYEIKSKDDAKSWTDLANLCRILNQTPPDKLEAALAPVLDVDNALRFLAIDNALVNDDGYWTRSSDYSIYEDPQGRFHLFPWDTNETFAADEIGGSGRMGPPGFGPGAGFGGPGGPGGGPDPFGGPGPGRGGRGGPGGPGGGRGGPGGGAGRGGPGTGGSPTLDPLVGLNDTTKPLRSKLLAVPALRGKYLVYVKDIAAKWLDWNTIGPLATKAQAGIASDVQADPKKLDTYEAFQSGMTALKTFADERRVYLMSYKDPNAGR